MLRTILSASLSVAAVTIAMSATTPAFAEYPDRPITWIVPWGAGGGTDATSRMLAGLAEKELGVPVNVVNRTGGSGVVGHSAIAMAKPDGYTVGTVTVEINMMHWAGLTDLDYTAYTPLALYNADPAGVHVAADSKFNSTKDILAAIKAEPGKLKSSGTGQGGIWHLAMAGLLVSADLEPSAAPWVPSKGSAPALQDLVSGGVDVVTCSVSEASSLLSAGKIKTLAVMNDERLASYPDIPTLKEDAGFEWDSATWRGVGAPNGIPDEAKSKLEAALKKAYDSEEFQAFMKKRGFGAIYRDGAGFGEWMASTNDSLGEVMKAAGLAK